MTAGLEPDGGTAIRVGISSCLLGAAVRFDGGHKHDRYLTGLLGDHFEWVAVCPEVEAGLGTPREAMRLEREPDGVHLRAIRSRDDHTHTLKRLVSARVRELERADLCGYVLKSKSPSCGMERVRVYGPGSIQRNGRGLFAQALSERLPNLPVEEEGRLNDARLRENWIERVFAYRRLRLLFAAKPGRGRLVAFHTAHKMQLLAHSPSLYRSLGRLIAAAKDTPLRELRERYCCEFMEALSKPATPRRHQNVLQHALGQLRGVVDAATSQQLHDLMEEYGAGLVPLVVPITLLRHHVERLEIDSLAGQTYLDPHPRELMLRNHV